MNSFENIKLIVDRVLGAPRRDYGGAGDWYEYNCPRCAEEGLGQADNKYNLAVQIGTEGLWAHCWKCGYSGKLYKVIKQHGSQADVDDFKEEVRTLREKRLFTLSDDLASSLDSLFIDDELKLPEGLKTITKEKLAKIPDNWVGSKVYQFDIDLKCAYDYLKSRGITYDMIERFKIGYIPNIDQETGKRYKYGGRVLIPSYDMYGDLNYWVARDYTDTQVRKVMNPDVDKKSIVFNEQFINWYEPINIVEGPFDHISVPNSIPLLGCSIDEETYVFKTLIDKSRSNINIFLDNDAIEGATKMYYFLNKYLPDRVRIVKCPDGYDPSDYYRDFGYKGIINLIRKAEKLDEYTLAQLAFSIQSIKHRKNFSSWF